jgi:DNA repair protein RecN (Recombination protein N)
MIVELRVRDLATIADVTLTLGPGLNVLTGETGAGKSMLVDALSLLLGGRADVGAVRPGAARLTVEGVFEPLPHAVPAVLDALGLDADDSRLVIRREVSAEGRSRAWVNGSPTTVGALGELGRLLADLHGQHDTQTLVQGDRQRLVLDRFADAESDVRAVAEQAALAARLAREEAELAARCDEVRRRADYLRHVTAEIAAARIRPGEDAELDAEARKLGQAGALVDLAARISAALDDEERGALAALARADRALDALARADPPTAAWRELLDTAFSSLQECSQLAATYARDLVEDPQRLAQVESRRDVLFRLKQKYGATLEAVLDTARQAAAELELLDTAPLELNEIAQRRRAAQAELQRWATVLGQKRRVGAERLARSVNRLLPKLGLPGGEFTVQLEPLAEVGVHGAESVEFLVRFNPGLDLRPLARSASGGERSRVLLALAVVLGRHHEVPTLVFDEVDAGIGGEVGVQVAAALAEVSRRHQVLVITHLPQIAARADRHLVVAKRTRAGIATSDVTVVHGEDRVIELARMLGDADAETARRHALALLQ